MNEKSNIPSKKDKKRAISEVLIMIQSALRIESCGHCKNVVTEYSQVWGEYIKGCAVDLMDTREYCHCEGFSISDKTKSLLERLKKELEE